MNWLARRDSDVTREEAECGPVYETLGPEYEDGTVSVREIATGHIFIALAEFIRLANADSVYGKRPRARNEYN